MSIRSARVKRGLSIKKAAEALNVSRETIYYWESGVCQPRADRLVEIAKLYECTVEDLLKEGDA